MSTQLPPDGTAFYFTRRLLSVKAPNNGVPIVDADTVTDYAGLALRYDYYKGTLANGKLTTLETWKRTERDLPGSFIAGGEPLGSIEIVIPKGGISAQKARFFCHDANRDAWVEVDYSKTEGNNDFIRVYLVAIPDSDDTETVYEQVQQRLVTKSTWEYDADGNAVSQTEAHAETGFEPVTKALPRMKD